MSIKTACTLLATTNVALTAPAAATLGGTRVSYQARALMAGQTTGSQNGIYVAGQTGSAILSGSEVYDGSGDCTVTGLTAGVVYSWRKGTNGTSLTNGTEVLTESGWFVAAGTSVDLEGTPSEDVVDYIYAAAFARATDADEAGDWAESWTVEAAGVAYVWLLVDPFTLGTTTATITALSTTPVLPWEDDTTAPTTSPVTPWAPDAPGTPAGSLVSVVRLTRAVPRTRSVLAGGWTAVATGSGNVTTGTTTHYVNTGTLTRVSRNMPYVDRVKFRLATKTNITSIQVAILRYASSKMYVVGQSENFISRVTGGTTVDVTLARPIMEPRIGDYICLSVTATSSASPFVSTTAQYQTLWAVDAASLADGTFTAPTGTFTDNTTIPVQVYGPPADVLGIGDSLVAGTAASAGLRTTTTDAAYTGLDMFAGLRGIGLSCQNMGIGGNVSQDLLDRWQTEVLDQHPLIVVLHVGGNDIGSISDVSELPAKQATAIANYQAMVDSCVSAGIKVLVLGILPRTAWCTTENYPVSRARRALNNALRSMVTTRFAGSALYMDTDTVVGQYYSGGDVGNLDALVTGYAHADEVHLNSSGQAAMSAALLSFVQTNLL